MVGSSVVVGDQVLDSIEVHVYMGDATNDELVQKKKVHVGFVFSAQAAAADLKQYIEEAEGVADFGIHKSFTPCEVQEVYMYIYVSVCMSVCMYV